MTSFGRGRGWYLQNREQGLRRPGGTFCSNDVVKDILNKLSSCDQVTPQLIQEIIDLLTNPTNKESLRYYTGLSLTIIVLLFFNVTFHILERHVTCFGNNPYSTTPLLQSW